MPTTACLPAAADVGGNGPRRHGDVDGVRSDNAGGDRSRRTRGKRVLVKQCRQTQVLITRPLISMIYSVNITRRARKGF